MTTASEVLAAVRARVAAVRPTGTDHSDMAHNVPEGALDGYLVALRPGDSQPTAAGSGTRFQAAQIAVSVWWAPGATPAAEALAVGEAVRDAILAAPLNLGGLVWALDGASIDHTRAPASRQLARVDVVLTARWVG
ncbi:MAG: hypothetical protein H5U20_03570 [Rhodobacteraceae bacterium]|nr:hypothetical protein [Paracoccaceae bacterium]